MTGAPHPPELLSLAAAARRLQLDVTIVRKMVLAGTIESVELYPGPSGRRVVGASVDRFIAKASGQIGAA